MAGKDEGRIADVWGWPVTAESPDGTARLYADGIFRRLGVSAGHLVSVESPRGRILVTARIGLVGEGTVFVPFHYGYWDVADDDSDGRDPSPPRAANELTMTIWDPVSKQPVFKTAACRVSRLDHPSGDGSEIR